MNDIVFITDTHITGSSRVRTGDVLEDILNKLEFVVDYCNDNDCILLIGGDVFDKPTVPDFVKNAIIPVLMKLHNKCYSVAGNHSTLYDNPEYMYKTSYQTLISAGLLEDLDSVDCIELDDCFITSKTPLINRGKPQIVVKHAFLNVDDGQWTFRFTDLNGVTDATCVLLGHDHVEYEDLKYTENIKIIRPGSFLRGIRNDENHRNPKLVHLRIKDGRILTKKVEIKCRAWEEIFKTKEIKTTKAQQHASYEAIIDSIRNYQKSDLTFEQAMNQVADPAVVKFAMEVLEEANLENNFKKV